MKDRRSRVRAVRLLHVPAPTAPPPPLSKFYQLPRTHRETRVQSHPYQPASSAAHENLCPGDPRLHPSPQDAQELGTPTESEGPRQGAGARSSWLFGTFQPFCSLGHQVHLPSLLVREPGTGEPNAENRLHPKAAVPRDGLLPRP